MSVNRSGVKVKRPISNLYATKAVKRAVNYNSASRKAAFSTEEQLFCISCERHFKTKASFARHQKTHQVILGGSEKEEDSSHSKATFPEKSTASVRGYPCPSCHKTFGSQYIRRLHLRVHRTKKEFACNVCGQLFTNSEEWKCHIQSSLNNAHCETCNQNFGCITAKENHICMESSHYCPICDLLFVKEWALMRHLQKYHSNEQECPCGKSSAVCQDYLKHMKMHQKSKVSGKTAEKPAKNKIEGKMSNEKTETNVCDVCSKKFDSNRTLRNHKRIHGLSDEANSSTTRTCIACSKTFTSHKALRAHLCHKKDYSVPQKKQKLQENTGNEEAALVKSGSSKDQIVLPKDSPVEQTDQNSEGQIVSKSHISDLLDTKVSKDLNVSCESRSAVISNPSDLKCRECPRLFVSVRALNIHFKKAHRRRRKHKKKHLKNNDNLCITCRLCFRRFRNLQLLTVHEKFHHKATGAKSLPNSRIPAKCNEILAEAELVNTASNIEETVSKPTTTTPKVKSCNFCPKRFKTNKRLRYHIRFQHLSIKKNVQIKSDPLPKDDVLQTKENLETSAETLPSLKEKPQETRKASEPIAVSKPFVACKNCGKKFQQMGSLNSHYCQCILRNDNKELKQLPSDTSTADVSLIQESPVASTPKAKYFCKLCNKKFKKSAHLTNHKKFHSKLETDHDSSREEDAPETPSTTTPVLNTPTARKTCRICSAKFSSTELLGLHMQCHTSVDGARLISVSSFKCDSNPKSSETVRPLRVERTKKDKLNQELKEKEPTFEKGLRCRRCSKIFRNTKALENHWKVLHAVPGSLKCKECDKMFVTQRSLNVHYGHVHKKSPDEILSVPKEIEPPLDLSSDMKMTSTKYSCKVCYKEFNKMTQLKGHRARCAKEMSAQKFLAKEKTETETVKEEILDNNTRKDSIKENIPESTPESYQCLVCTNSFRSHNQLELHQKECGKEMTVKKCSSKEAMETVEEGILVESTTEIGIKEKSPNSLPDVYQCSVCTKAYRNRSQLEIHEKIHNNEEHICKECGRRFWKLTQLKVHMRTHSSFSGFQCDVCKVNFQTRSRMRIHRSSHFGIYRYISFPSGSHNKRPTYQCKHCNKMFISLLKFELHCKSLDSDTKEMMKKEVIVPDSGSTTSSHSNIEHNSQMNVIPKEPTESAGLPEEAKEMRNMSKEEARQFLNKIFQTDNFQMSEINTQNNPSTRTFLITCPECNQHFKDEEAYHFHNRNQGICVTDCLFCKENSLKEMKEHHCTKECSHQVPLTSGRQLEDSSLVLGNLAKHLELLGFFDYLANGGIFQCPVCQYTFTKSNGIMNHLCAHADKGFIYSLCNVPQEPVNASFTHLCNYNCKTDYANTAVDNKSVVNIPKEFCDVSLHQKIKPQTGGLEVKQTSVFEGSTAANVNKVDPKDGSSLKDIQHSTQCLSSNQDELKKLAYFLLSQIEFPTKKEETQKSDEIKIEESLSEEKDSSLPPSPVKENRDPNDRTDASNDSTVCIKSENNVETEDLCPKIECSEIVCESVQQELDEETMEIDQQPAGDQGKDINTQEMSINKQEQDILSCLESKDVVKQAEVVTEHDETFLSATVGESCESNSEDAEQSSVKDVCCEVNSVIVTNSESVELKESSEIASISSEVVVVGSTLSDTESMVETNSVDIEVVSSDAEPVTICSNEKTVNPENDPQLVELRNNFSKLLCHLVGDPEVLADLGWPDRLIDDVLVDVILRCDHSPSVDSNGPTLQNLRRNISILLSICVKEQAMESFGWNSKSVEEVVKEMLRGGEIP